MPYTKCIFETLFVMMRKIFLLLIITFAPALVYAQSRDITIHWDANNFSAVSKATGVNDQTKTDQRLSEVNLVLEEDQLAFYYQWEDNRFVDQRSVQVTNISYGTLSSEELKRINTNLVPTTPTYSLQSSKARSILYSFMTISPVVNVNGQLRKIQSFSVNYSYSTSTQADSFITLTNSVLATGDWYKFKIDQTGIYRISKNFLNDLGMNTNGIDPRSIKVYGNGGKPLPLVNADNTIFDLPETSIQVIGEEDGSFNDSDFILFYAEGAGLTTTPTPQGADFQDSLGENGSNLNPYSDEVYYYITAGGAAGKRVQPMVEPTAAATNTITTFNDYAFHEEDAFSPAKVGRKWYGNRFDVENEQSFEFNFPNISNSEPVAIRIVAAAASEVGTSMAITINSTSVNPLSFGSIADPTLLREAFYNGEISASGDTVTVDLDYNNSGNPSSIGYLDYIGVSALRNLIGVDGQMSFRFDNAINLLGVGEYQIGNASQFSQVWDVTNPAFISSKQNEDGANSFSFKATLGSVREYVAINPNDYFTPTQAAVSRVANQNLKGTIMEDASGNFQDVDYLIVTAPFLLQPALRLANHHKTVSGLRVKVVTTDKIYEEFSSGKQDIGAIRNFVRYIYGNASSENNRLKYLCLFGDTSVDYKDRLSNNNNIVPSFHTVSSISTFSSFVTDDYFGMMSDPEGTLVNTDKLDIAVGRILADNVSLANAMVDKIVDYSEKSSYGNWRNNLVLVSDDVDVDWEHDRLQVVLDGIGDQITVEKPYVNVKKIHSDSYQQETSAGGNRYPEVKEAIINGIEVGALILNYFGHGGEDGLAKEFIYTKGVAEDLKNENNYPCIVTVTCEFTKFDNPLRITAGELTFWNREGGAVSLITTTRSISVSLGVTFNQELAVDLFGFGLDIPVPPAEALRLSKNRIGNVNRRVVFYVGDPALRLAFPKQRVELTTLNGQPIASSGVVLKALSKITMGGVVLDEAGNLLSDYNGVAEIKVFDKNQQRQTLGNDGTTSQSSSGELLILDFVTLGEVLFNGQASVTNGQFEVDFVVPRDIQIQEGQGKVSLYAQRNGVLEDQTGANLDIQVGGLDENAPEDNEGPQIQLFMNDESFVSGGITNDSPLLLANLEDENGINTSSGIGHDIVAVLDGDEENPFVLNEYYQAEVDDYTRGVTSYKLRNLEEGLHTLTLKAWDVYNNSSTSEIQFIVAGDDEISISRVLNYPNPFVNYTEFWFNHNRPFEPLEVQVQVFTVTGKVVWTQNQIINTDGFLSRDIVWDGRDDFGDRIGKGTYIYKITVKSTLTNQQTEKYEKLVIL